MVARGNGPFKKCSGFYEVVWFVAAESKGHADCLLYDRGLYRVDFITATVTVGRRG